MYAIIATGGKQYKVAEGDVIRVEKLGVEAGETVTFDQVLAVSNDGLKVGEDRQDYRDNRHQRQEAQGNSAVADELRRAGRAVRDKLRASSARRFRRAVPEVFG